MDLLKTLLPLIILIAISMAQKKGTDAAKKRRKRPMPPPRQSQVPVDPEIGKRPSLAEWIQQMQGEEPDTDVLVSDPESVPEPEIATTIPPPIDKEPREKPSHAGGRPSNTGGRPAYTGGRPSADHREETTEEHVHWSEMPVVQMEEAEEMIDEAPRSSRRRSKDSARARKGGARIKLRRNDLRHAIVLSEVMAPPIALRD